MRTAIFTFIVSIFFAGNICKAQDTEGKYQICNTSGKLIPIKVIQKISTDSCDIIKFTDSEGNDYKITSYTFAISPKKGGNAYFENANGETLTATIKEKLAKASPDDLVVFANIECITHKGLKERLSGFNFSIIP